MSDVIYSISPDTAVAIVEGISYIEGILLFFLLVLVVFLVYKFFSIFF